MTGTQFTIQLTTLLGTVLGLGAFATVFAAGKPAADQDAAARVVESIAWGADLHEWETVRAAFADPAVLDYGTPETLTPDQIVGRWQPLLEAFDTTRHSLSDVRVEVKGEKATAGSRFEARHILRGAPGGEQWILAGRYEHDLVKTPQGWKVTRMRMIPEESTGNTKLVELAQQKAKETAAGTEGLRDRNREVVRNFFERLEAFDIEGFAALFAEDGVQVMPFSPEGFPKRLEGRAAVFNQYKGMPQNFTRMRFPDLAIQDLADPGRFFVTYRGEIGLRAGGEYNNHYAALFVIRDGKIAEFVEYFDPITLQKAFGSALQDNFNVDSQGPSGGVRMEKVTFESEGVRLTGNLYRPAGDGGSRPGVLVTGSWTTVKEQMPALYAQRLAEQGYVALTFDFRGYGESAGEPRDFESPARKAEDIRNAVTYLQSVSGVDRERIGALAVCASTGYAAVAASRDDRIRSLAFVAPWLHDAEIVQQIYGAPLPGTEGNGVQARLEQARKAREKFERTGQVDYVVAASDKDATAAMYGPIDYYLNPERGAIPQWGNRFAVMAWTEWLQFDPIRVAPEIRVPVLLVHSEEAAVPDGARQFYQGLKGPKDFLWTTGNQFDFYDSRETVDKAANAAARHFEETLGR